MSDSPSVASRPTESELDLELAELVNWQRFATHLPDLTRGDIEQIEQDHRDDVQRKKLELYGRWLTRCPNASWNNIVLALEKSNEFTLANVIKRKLYVQTASNATESYNQVQFLYLPSEENVVEEIKQLHRSFVSFAKAIRGKLDELIKSGISSLRDIATFIQEAHFGIKGLTEVKTIYELFGAILPHIDYLDCELLEMIAEKFVHNDDITHQVKSHIDKVKLFKRTAPIKDLKNKLQQYTSIPNISDMHLIVNVKLQTDWGRVTLKTIEILVRNLLQYQHKVRILPMVDESGSIPVSNY